MNPTFHAALVTGAVTPLSVVDAGKAAGCSLNALFAATAVNGGSVYCIANYTGVIGMPEPSVNRKINANKLCVD